ncbi:hypothetical protein RHGRI_010428 [Rhododendron griersonianum]|uniref:Uncharacterized protein n=1 Tax=Rhododendron griersonianum TaxID=479676 RepID=A0AAV6KIS3_9ERIC|nr:hypothetical protein RHGRI_010428 [Rhododendron griersonianum]
MDIELGHNNFCEITGVEMVMMADGRGVVRMVAAFARMLMPVRRLDCGEDPIATVLGKIESLEDGVGGVLGKIEGAPFEENFGGNDTPFCPLTSTGIVHVDEFFFR